MKGASRSYGMLLVYIITGAILGGILGGILSDIAELKEIMSYLVYSYPVLALEPSVIDIYILKFTLGISFTPNLMSGIGIALAIWIFNRG